MRLNAVTRGLLCTATAMGWIGCAAVAPCRTTPPTDGLSLVVAAGDDSGEWQLATDAASLNAPKSIWSLPLRVPNQCDVGDRTFYDRQGNHPGPVGASS